MSSLKPLILMALASANLAMAQDFYPERGDHRFSLDDVVREFDRSGVDYVRLDRSRAIKGARYMLVDSRNEFQIQNWFQRDWFAMQDMFRFDLEAYLRAQGERSLNLAKRKQYRGFSFDHEKSLYKKSVPAMREWGGLTHPPLKTLPGPLPRYHSNYPTLDYARIRSAYFDPELQRQIDAVSRSELTFGNELSLLADRAAFEAKKHLIAGARQSIFMSSLVFACDRSSRQLVDLLRRKRRQGVDVRVMADGTLAKLLGYRECLELLRRDGVQVLETKDFFKHKRFAIYHTKTLVVDFQYGIAGGHNMLDADNFSRGTDFKNRDIDLQVKGPMATDIAKQFIENWHYHLGLLRPKDRRELGLTPMLGHRNMLNDRLAAERAQAKRGSQHYARMLGSPTSRMRGVCRFIKQAPYEDRHTIGKAYLKLLDQVQNYLLIQNPIILDTERPTKASRGPLEKFDNFDMFNQLYRKVQGLARRGLYIDYQTNNIDMAGNETISVLNEQIADELEEGKTMRANLSFLQLTLYNSFFGNFHYKNLFRDWLPHRSIHIWKHMSFLHSKVFYFDRIVASVGSYNLHHNATDHAYESTSICMDKSLNHQLDRIVVQDMANSLPLVPVKR